MRNPLDSGTRGLGVPAEVEDTKGSTPARPEDQIGIRPPERRQGENRRRRV